ncbi:Putative membrane-spanning protein [hydrothermal vent metagenome]|uniref:Membrane-spanning protein n=1 Tax=hydrothermal vent metagenome TaxID=652676 RepID=A0A3B0U880_9ZZZZ
MNSLKIVSWNLLYRRGAAVCDVAVMIEKERPDLFLMQEATEDIDNLSSISGGRFYKLPWKGKTYSLALWAPGGEIRTRALELPFSRLPGKFPPRVAQLVDLGNVTIANVHLSHGQLLNRRQLRAIARAVDGPLAIIGDFNALGPLVMRGFKDVGPRRITHVAKRVVPFRLDRCFVRELKCVTAKALEKGPSDHRPIVVELAQKLAMRRSYA